MRQDLRGQVQHQLSTGIDLTRWVGSIGLAVAVGIAYFAAARLSLALLANPEGVAAFWPAAAVSAGACSLSGPGRHGRSLSALRQQPSRRISLETGISGAL